MVLKSTPYFLHNTRFKLTTRSLRQQPDVCTYYPKNKTQPYYYSLKMCVRIHTLCFVGYLCVLYQMNNSQLRARGDYIPSIDPIISLQKTTYQSCRQVLKSHYFLEVQDYYLINMNIYYTDYRARTQQTQMDITSIFYICAGEWLCLRCINNHIRDRGGQYVHAGWKYNKDRYIHLDMSVEY